MSFSFRDRPDYLKAASAQVFDIIVIGGGITGAAVLRNAALRGLKALLIESQDFGSGTSSGSSKLIHGGLRYLENFEFKLVREAIHERESMKKLYAPLVRDLQFVFPTFSHRPPPRWKLNIGLFLYNAFSGFQHPHRNLSKSSTLRLCPSLESENLSGACIYNDGFAEDYRLVIEIIKSAQKQGALALSQTEVTKIQAPSDGKSFFELSVTDKMTLSHGHHDRSQKNETTHDFTVRAKHIINCAGPFSDEIRALLSLPPTLSLTQGVHFIVAKEKLNLGESTHAIVLSDPDLHRILFVIPWGPVFYIGTTDTFVTKVADARASQTDLDYVLRIFHKHFKVRLQKNDILNSWVAVRPLIAPHNNKSASAISRDFVIEENPKGFVHVLGGKLTSHRIMAQSALNSIPGLHQSLDPTDRMPLFQDPLKAVINPSLETAVNDEMVLHTMDYLRRRSSLYYHSPSVSEAHEIARQLKDLLGRDERWLKAEHAAIEKEFLWDQGGY